MALSETQMQVIWIVGMILIPVVSIWYADRRITRGFEGLVDRAIDRVEARIPSVDNIKAEATKFASQIEKKVDEKVDDFVDSIETTFDEKMTAVFTSANTLIDNKLSALLNSDQLVQMGEAIGDRAGEAIGQKIAMRISQSKGGQNKGRGGGGMNITDMFGIPDVNQMSELANFAMQNPEMAQQFMSMAQQFRGGNGNGGQPPSYGQQGQGVPWSR